MGEWKLAVGEWKLAVREWKLAVREWKLAAGEWKILARLVIISCLHGCEATLQQPFHDSPPEDERKSVFDAMCLALPE